MQLLVVASFFAAAVAVPQYNQYNQYNPDPYYNQNSYQRQVVPIVSQTNDVGPDGSFRYSYQTGDGISAEASGAPRPATLSNEQQEVIQGNFAYTAPDGTPVALSYVADEFGYHPEGSHLPTPPPIPEAIQRSLEVIAQAERNQPQKPAYQKPQPAYRQPAYQQPAYQQPAFQQPAFQRQPQFNRPQSFAG